MLAKDHLIFLKEEWYKPKLLKYNKFVWEILFKQSFFCILGIPPYLVKYQNKIIAVFSDQNSLSINAYPFLHGKKAGTYGAKREYLFIKKIYNS